MHILKSLYFDFVNLFTTGSSEPSLEVKRVNLNEGVAVPCPDSVKVAESQHKPALAVPMQNPVFANPSTALGVALIDPALRQSFAGASKNLGQALTPMGESPAHRDLPNSDLVVTALEQSALARPSYTHVLAIRENQLGSDHPDVDESLHNLGKLLLDQALYSRAEPVFKRSLAIRERVLGPNHLEVAESLHYLGKLYINQGLYSMAEPLFHRSLAIRERVLGAVHPSVAESLGKLAAVCAATGRYDQAVSLYSRSLAIYEKSIDLNRPLWEKTSENLALLRRFISQNT